MNMNPDRNPYDAAMELGTNYLAEYLAARVEGDTPGAIDKISQAIAAFERAYEIQPIDRPLVNLGNALWRRYELGSVKYRADIDSAISKQRQGIALQTKTNVVSLNNLGNMLRQRFEDYTHLDSQSDLDDALDAYRKAMPAYSVNPNISLDSARSYGELLARYRGASSALSAFQYTMDLIPRLASTGRRLLRRFDFLPKVRECVEVAVATAIAAGDLDLALEWFDRGRCIVWFQIMQTKLSLDDLRLVDVALADDIANIEQELSAVQSRLEAIRGQPISTPGRSGLLEVARTLNEKLTDLVQRVRQLDGFKDFMQYTSVAKLKQAARFNPVVALNMCRNGCDALIILPREGGVTHVSLPLLTLDGANEMNERFQAILRDAKVVSRGYVDPSAPVSQTNSIHRELAKLWRCVVGPILTSLGCTGPLASASDMRRVVWCPSGPLCFLPLHAAGLYGDVTKTSSTSSIRAIDCVVSSYTPSISTLVDLLEQSAAPEHNATQSQVLAISQPATPDWPPIPSTFNEVVRVRNLVGSNKLTWLNGNKATVKRVLELLRSGDFSSLHLACHGIQDLKNPLQSAFILDDGKITLRNVMDFSTGGKTLAVLSACQTATGSSESPEEALHLTAGMLMAGYLNVVGTMWSVGDHDAPIVMGKLYESLLQKDADAARALHEAVNALRTTVGEHNFIRWMPFVHYGV